MAHLTLVLQGREVRKFVLNPTVTTIGRAQDNDIVINNLALSRRHAHVEKKSGRYEVADLGSQNGVYVNSERVRGARTLADADTITLGTYHFVFNDTSASDPDVKAAVRPKPKNQSQNQPETTETGDHKKEAPRDKEKDEPENVPLLVLKYNDVELQRFPLKNASCLVGRAKDCDVQIAERRLSRKHCEIVREGERYFVKDLGSQNGTYVNRKRIRDFHDLKDGDVLNFAEYSVLFLADVAEYDGPDLVHARRQAAQQRSERGPGPRPGSGIEAEETEFPEAYGEGGFDDANAPSIVPDDDQVHPSDMTEDPEVSGGARPPMSMMPSNGRVQRRPIEDDDRAEPFIEDPAHARERRGKQPRRVIRESRPAPSNAAPAAPPPARTRGGDELPARRAPAHDGGDPIVREPPIPKRGTVPDAPAVLERERERDRHERERDRGERHDHRDRGERNTPDRGERTAERNLDRGGPKGPVKKNAPPAPRPRREVIEDVPDEVGDVLPDEGLEDWYKAREEKSEVFEEEDSSVLLRGKSSVSQILSTMMVDKRELDRNLSAKARQRKFFVDVRWGEEKIYSGPLNQQVTILGTDREADIQLKGRYVAGRHSILVRVRDSLLLVRLGSSSAARVNGLPKLQTFLKTGDVIQIDETTIKISED